ncbi:hypothetical protein [Pontibacter mangrovi]|uniref:STAS/SEC14 domain-containing protein n=1 Tax=Pontibacter mangrovi TaxID=2589816 RepID=A0A501W609_9BACT|nr:hypothetical protein [Pontibacter mangrovi]TPE41046.1 hypothetical protein FJM65_19570 [Pontibacter mangrovi]
MWQTGREKPIPAVGRDETRMILFSNGLITLDYNPATDIMTVGLPDIRTFSAVEVERALQVVVETITSYDIKKLLIDSSQAVVEVDDATYRLIILGFSQALAKTRLQYVARVESARQQQEDRAARVTEEAKRKGALSITHRNFPNAAEALEWLQAQ